MDSTLRPRDIQARIRAGESAEQVAEAAGASVEKIMPYAAPVLAERAHQAQTALRASVRRSVGHAGGARTLGQCVDQFLSEHRLHDHDLAWDSWRRPDGRWLLVAELELEGRAVAAELVHDVRGRYVVAQNDDARLLTGEATLGSPEEATAGGSRRLSSVAAVGPLGEESPLGDDAIELVREDDQVTELDWSAPTGVATTDAEDVPEPQDELEPDPAPVAEADSPADDEDTVEVAFSEHGDEEPGEPGEPGEADVADEHDDQPALDLGPDHEPEEKPAKPARKGRASVPSWDEIMFGGGPKE